MAKSTRKKLSMSWKEKTQWLKDNNCLSMGETDIHVCRKDTKYESCKKKIKRGLVYFRRSFGQMWTWRACSELCALQMEKESEMWIL